MNIAIVTGPYSNVCKELNSLHYDYIIGADVGALMIAEEGIFFDLAVGDFDSVVEKDLVKIKKYAKELKKFPEVKDYTDTFLALQIALKKEPTNIDIFGGIGDRVDHTYANLNLLKNGNIQIITENERLYVLKPGTYNIENEYDYISFFPQTDVKKLTLKGFKYQVNELDLEKDSPLGISNEGSGEISFTEGKILVIHQFED